MGLAWDTKQSRWVPWYGETCPHGVPYRCLRCRYGPLYNHEHQPDVVEELRTPIGRKLVVGFALLRRGDKVGWA